LAKNLKLNIKNTQIAQAINLSGIKSKLAKKKEEEVPKKEVKAAPKTKGEAEELPKEEAPRIRARSKSAFAEPITEALPKEAYETPVSEEALETKPRDNILSGFGDEHEETPRARTSAEIRQDIFGDQNEPEKVVEEKPTFTLQEKEEPKAEISTPAAAAAPEASAKDVKRVDRPKEMVTPPPMYRREHFQHPPREQQDKLGPTGRHMKDFIRPPKPAPVPPRQETNQRSNETPAQREAAEKLKLKPKPRVEGPLKEVSEEESRAANKPAKFKEFRDIKPTTRKVEPTRTFDARDRQGLRTSEEDQHWRKRRGKQQRYQQEDTTIRPTTLKVRIPISIKDLASEMKLKASQLISKLFLQGMVLTLNDLLEDETTIQLLGQEFGCEITIDTAEEKRIQITDKTIREELSQTPAEDLIIRPPVVAFMGHVDHGKTSLIDAIRKSNRAAGEAGAITQHIGAFRCSTPVGDIAFLDTPGHEAFSAMRARGADVTDIVVLVVAGDEGIRQQSLEAIHHARAAKVTIVVAINKSDKPNFNADNVYRQLADNDLLPESWGGQIITVNCSALTGEGIPQLLEMLALQAEVLELRANPKSRARGTVLESEMHKGMGAVATILVQNGTLKRGDSVVFGQHWGRIKTMHNEYGRELTEAGPSTPVEITGLSGLPEAGQEFIVVKNEKEAREIAEVRSVGARQSNLVLQQKKKATAENVFQLQANAVGKKILNVVLRADVQGSLEAMKSALMKIETTKADLNIIYSGVGEVTESDVQLAAASKAVIIGFHTQIEGHAEPIIKELGVQVRLHDIIYHAVDDARVLMAGLLEKIAIETEKGKALVKATFKSSHTGIIAGCQVTEGAIQRSNHVRLRRGKDVIWKGTITSLKRVKEDVREVSKGVECGIVLKDYSEMLPDDIIEAYEVTYIAQEL
jgi:translation initiation factor IF-2